MRPSWLALPALALALAVAGCGSSDEPSTASTKAQGSLPGRGKPPVTLGTKNFTEQFILGQLYKQALEAKGFKVVLKNNIGASEIIDRALTGDRLDMYPEYIGVIAQELAKVTRRPRSEAETYRRAKLFEESRGFTLLDRSPGFDADANAVRPDYARRYRLNSTGDLKRVGAFRYGGPAENRSRFQGAVGMRQVYGLHKLRYVPVPIEQRYRALKNGRVDVI